MNRQVDDTAASSAKATGIEGRHWLLDFSACACDALLLADRATLEAACLDACRAAGLAIVGSQFHQFAPHGVTGVVLLAESHLSVHTWPDEGFAAVDVYVCNHSKDNSAKGELLSQLMTQRFRPEQCDERVIQRTAAASRDRVDAMGSTSFPRDKGAQT